MTLVGGEPAPLLPYRRSGYSAKAAALLSPWRWFESEGASVVGSPSGSSKTPSVSGSGLSANHQPLPRTLRNSAALERRAARVATGFLPPTSTPRRRTSGNNSTSLTGAPRSSKIARTVSRVRTVTGDGCLTFGLRFDTCAEEWAALSRLSASAIILKSLLRLASSAASSVRAADMIVSIVAPLAYWQFGAIMAHCHGRCKRLSVRLGGSRENDKVA